MTAIKFRVNTVQSERGWGQTYGCDDFDTYDEAKAYRDKINSYNTASTTPDWYIIAEDRIDVIEVK